MAGAPARTGWTRSIRSTPTPATTRSRTSNPICRCASGATSCATTPPPRGRWRGGIGSIREVGFLEDSSISVEGDGHAFRPWGFNGGAEGGEAALVYHRADGTDIPFPSMMPNRAVRAGESLTLTGTCGGGYGNAAERPAVAVADDVRDGYISRETAERAYGVVVTGSGDLDAAATEARRRPTAGKP